MADSYENSAFYIEGKTLDICGGHATTDGWYHYHATAGCLQEQAMADAGVTAAEHSPQLGWSYVSDFVKDSPRESSAAHEPACLRLVMRREP